METILMMILSSLWALIVVEYFTPIRHFLDGMGMGKTRTLVSDYIGLDYIFYIIHKIFNCSSCFSSHLFWISYLIVNGSFFGMILCPIVYFLTFIIKERVLVIKLN